MSRSAVLVKLYSTHCSITSGAVIYAMTNTMGFCCSAAKTFAHLHSRADFRDLISVRFRVESYVEEDDIAALRL